MKSSLTCLLELIFQDNDDNDNNNSDDDNNNNNNDNNVYVFHYFCQL